MHTRESSQQRHIDTIYHRMNSTAALQGKLKSVAGVRTEPALGRAAAGCAVPLDGLPPLVARIEHLEQVGRSAWHGSAPASPPQERQCSAAVTHSKAYCDLVWC